MSVIEQDMFLHRKYIPSEHNIVFTTFDVSGHSLGLVLGSLIVGRTGLRIGDFLRTYHAMMGYMLLYRKHSDSCW